MTIRSLRPTLVLVVLMLLAMPATAAPSARAQLDAFAEGATSLSCDFVQQVTSARGDARPEVHGTLALATPRSFRWKTDKPQEQLIVADGEKVWVYDPALEQVTVRPQSSAEAQSPLTVLTDLSRLDKDFVIIQPAAHDGMEWLRLVPKADNAQFEHVEIGVADGEPKVMIFADKLGGQSRITFSHWQRNPDLPADTFRFTPPEGVDVVRSGGMSPGA